MDFLSSAYRKLKMGIAGIGGAGSVAIIVGGAVLFHGALGIIMIVGGSVWLATSGFVLFDGVKAHSEIAKGVKKLNQLKDEFRQENFVLGHLNKELKLSAHNIDLQNKTLQKNIDDAAANIISLTRLKQQYEKNLRVDSKNLKKMEKKINDLGQIKYELTHNLDSLRVSLVKSEKELETMKALKDNYTEENEKLQKANEKNASTIKVLKNQVDKLHKLYENTKSLLASLASAGDAFSEFKNTIGEVSGGLVDTKEGYDQTLERMEELLEKMKNSSFGNMDKDGDGVITEKEFLKYIDGQSDRGKLKTKKRKQAS